VCVVHLKIFGLPGSWQILRKCLALNIAFNLGKNTFEILKLLLENTQWEICKPLSRFKTSVTPVEDVKCS